eukprot:scaffold793_cov161-Amphora_coffeaeformis.AAC.5
MSFSSFGTAHEPETPCLKKLRSSEKDLRVIVGSTAEQDKQEDQDEQEQNQEKDDEDEDDENDTTVKEYLFHSVVLATYSTYIDTMLAVPMKESTERVIRFPDLKPSTWEAMMKFLHPVQSRKMTMKDTKDLAPYYDKYDFTFGRDCCDDVVQEIFDKARQQVVDGKMPDDLNALIAVYELADTAHLPKTILQLCTNYDESTWPLHVFGISSSKTSTIYSTRQSHPSNFRLRCLVKEILRQAVTAVEISGVPGFDAVYTKEFTFGGGLDAPPLVFSNGERLVRFTGFIQGVYRISIQWEEDWIIRGTNTHDAANGQNAAANNPASLVLWRCPYSSAYEVLPPETGWVPVQGMNTPKLKYIYRN